MLILKRPTLSSQNEQIEKVGLGGRVPLLKTMEKAKRGGDRKSDEYCRSEKSTGDPSGQKPLAELAVTNATTRELLSQSDQNDWLTPRNRD